MSGGPQKLILYDICGRYELVPTQGKSDVKKQERSMVSELVLASCGRELYGRFRIGGRVHGLLKIQKIPKSSSTGDVRFDIVIEDLEQRDSSWTVTLDEEGSIVTGAMAFLGGCPGLIALSHKVLGEQLLFGIKTEEGGGSGVGLKESWDAVLEKCGGKERELVGVREGHDGGMKVLWDEDVVDELVESLISR